MGVWSLVCLGVNVVLVLHSLPNLLAKFGSKCSTCTAFTPLIVNSTIQ
jgi:hypothetical protein